MPSEMPGNLELLDRRCTRRCTGAAERKLSDQPAGVPTYMLLTIGSRPATAPSGYWRR